MTGPAAEQPPRRLHSSPLLADHPVALRLSLILWAFGGFLFIALAIPALADIVQSVDDAAWQIAVDLENSFVVGIAKAFDFIGGSTVAAPVMVLVAVYLAWRKQWETFWFWLLAMGASQLLIGPVKILYARPRPPMSLVETTSFSFPSGHAVAGAAIAVSLVIALVPAGPKRRNLEMLAGVFALLMGLSRVYLRAHWFSDAAAGVAMGAAVAIAAAVIVHIVDDRRHPASQDTS